MLNNQFNQLLYKINLKKQYLLNLKKQSILLLKIKQNNYKLINKYFSNPNSKKYVKSFDDNTVMYIIDITFSRSNTFLHITDALGTLKFFASAGHFNYKGKNKKSRFNIFKSIYLTLLNKFNFLKGKPIALHLKNVGFKRFWIIKKLKNKFFIKIIKIFNSFPFNGCRKRKIRRKKFKKK
jgi:ribosomal protein S11